MSSTVSRILKNKVQQSVDFTTAVYDNTDKSSHEVYHLKPTQRLEVYYELMLVIRFVPAVLFIVAFAWLVKKPKNSNQKQVLLISKIIKRN